MRPAHPIPFLTLLISSVAITPSARTQDFSGCTLPFERVKESHPIDSTCDPEGKTHSDANRAAEHGQEQLLCGQRIRGCHFPTFRKLQQAAEDHGVPLGSRLNLPGGPALKAGARWVSSACRGFISTARRRLTTRDFVMKSA